MPGFFNDHDNRIAIIILGGGGCHRRGRILSICVHYFIPNVSFERSYNGCRIVADEFPFVCHDNREPGNETSYKRGASFNFASCRIDSNFLPLLRAASFTNFQRPRLRWETKFTISRISRWGSRSPFILFHQIRIIDVSDCSSANEDDRTKVLTKYTILHWEEKKENKSNRLTFDWFCSKNTRNQVWLTRNRYDRSHNNDYGPRS